MTDLKPPADPRICNRCGQAADMGMTCSGPRCQACGCDRPFGRGQFAELGPLERPGAGQHPRGPMDIHWEYRG